VNKAALCEDSLRWKKSGKAAENAITLKNSDYRCHYPYGEITYGDKRDVMIVGDRTIGIEITHLYLEDGKNPASQQVQRRVRPEVVATAEQI
jgi:hypothetical protein